MEISALICKLISRGDELLSIYHDDLGVNLEIDWRLNVFEKMSWSSLTDLQKCSNVHLLALEPLEVKASMLDLELVNDALFTIQLYEGQVVKAMDFICNEKLYFYSDLGIGPVFFSCNAPNSKFAYIPYGWQLPSFRIW